MINSAMAGAIAAAGTNSGQRWSDGTLWDDGTGWIDGHPPGRWSDGTLWSDGTGWIDGHRRLVDRQNQPVTIRRPHPSQTQRNGVTNPRGSISANRLLAFL